MIFKQRQTEMQSLWAFLQIHILETTFCPGTAWMDKQFNCATTHDAYEEAGEIACLLKDCWSQ